MAERVEPRGNQRTSGTPTGATRFERRGQQWLWLRGRMKPGVTPAQVRAEFVSLLQHLVEAYPEALAKERVVVVPARDVRINADAGALIAGAGLLLVAAVGLVLVVACANLADRLRARAAGRDREI